MFPKHIKFEGAFLILADVITHHLPMLYALFFLPNQGTMTLFVVICLLYLLLNDVRTNYSIRTRDFVMIVTIALILQYLFLTTS
jgi:hypothetical protein